MYTVRKQQSVWITDMLLKTIDPNTNFTRYHKYKYLYFIAF